MPFGPVLIRTSLPDVSGLAQDTVVNDFAFTGTGIDLDAAAAVTDFYNTTGPHAEVGRYLSLRISRSLLACSHAIYQLDTPAKLAGGPLGSPSLVVPWTLTAGQASSVELPREVALAASFRAGYGGLVEEAGLTRPRARARGRVFLGPFETLAEVGGSGNASRPAANLLDDVLAALVRLRDDALTYFSVWSRKNASLAPVTDVWVDNAWDTMRSRGLAPTLKLRNP